jgi:hypothetical protein
MHVDYNRFFNIEDSCPDNIPNCEALREQYKHELSEISVQGCTNCTMSKLKVKYLELIWQAFMNNHGQGN